MCSCRTHASDAQREAPLRLLELVRSFSEASLRAARRQAAWMMVERAGSTLWRESRLTPVSARA